jgi:DNA or RNA helicases of superfamily II
VVGKSVNIGSDDASEFKLAPWQETFVRSYLRELKQRSLLVAAVGAGKTVAALSLAEQMRAMLSQILYSFYLTDASYWTNGDIWQVADHLISLIRSRRRLN